MKKIVVLELLLLLSLFSFSEAAILGDFNNDGNLSIADVIALLLILRDGDPTGKVGHEYIMADGANGKIVSGEVADLILQQVENMPDQVDAVQLQQILVFWHVYPKFADALKDIFGADNLEEVQSKLVLFATEYGQRGKIEEIIREVLNSTNLGEVEHVLKTYSDNIIADMDNISEILNKIFTPTNFDEAQKQLDLFIEEYSDEYPEVVELLTDIRNATEVEQVQLLINQFVADYGEKYPDIAEYMAELSPDVISLFLQLWQIYGGP